MSKCTAPMGVKLKAYRASATDSITETLYCGANATWVGLVDGAHTARCDVHKPGGAEDQRREERSRLRLVILTVLVGLGAWLFIRFARGW